MKTVLLPLALVLAVMVLRAPSAEAQATQPPGLALPAGLAAAPPPDLPATIARDAEGRTTVRAVRLPAPLKVDGNLDEAIYTTLLPMSEFVQVEPRAGQPATEKTEVWITFDDENVYVSVRASESRPERMIVNEMRRDSFNLIQNENFQFAFDTYNDHRNAISMQFNPIGGRMDGQVTGENTFNSDWNPVWKLAVHRVEGGWTAEAAVPFKSIRYATGTSQVWGVQFRRINRWKNETSYLTRLPANTGINGHGRVAQYATMVGLEVPSGGTHALDLKPYVTSNVTTDRTARPSPIDDRVGKDWGFDAKYALTQTLSADVTARTDFAQVEADEQQVNLTRFSLFFPEKREFFLENQGLFQFGTFTTGNNTPNSTDPPTVFYSRRIGLDAGQVVPINVGGRVSGRLGRYSVGVMDIETRESARPAVPSTNFAVVRVKRDLLRRSSVGALYTRRSNVLNRVGDGETFGLDANVSVRQNIYLNGYWARSKNPGVTRDDQSYRAQALYNADRYAVQIERLHVGRLFDPQVGFVPRANFTKDRGFVRFSPRPRTRFRKVRRFNYQAGLDYYRDDAGGIDMRTQQLEFSTEFASSEKLTVRYDDYFEGLDVPFAIATGVRIPAAGYNYRKFTTEFQVGQQRMASGTWWVETGSFYDGDRHAFGYRGPRVKVNQHLALEPSFSINQVTLPHGDFTAKLFSSRTTYTFHPQMFVSGLVQYNSSNNSLSSNVRLRWEYQPGSELFIVYSDGRDTTGTRVATLQNRAFVVKMNRLFRY